MAINSNLDLLNAFMEHERKSRKGLGHMSQPNLYKMENRKSILNDGIVPGTALQAALQDRSAMNAAGSRWRDASGQSLASKLLSMMRGQ